MMDSEQDLLHDLYAAACDDRPWGDVVDAVIHGFGGFAGHLFTPFLPSSDRNAFSIQKGMPEDAVQRYLAEVADVDVWYHALLRKHGQLVTGFTYVTADLVPPQLLQRTRFHAEYLAGLDIHHSIGSIISDGSAEGLPVMTLCVYRHEGSPHFTEQEQVHYSALQRHFNRAMLTRVRLRDAVTDSLTLALERVSTPVVVLAADRSVLLANPAAETLFAEGGHRCIRAGRLCCEQPAQTLELERALRACSTYAFDSQLSLSVRLHGVPGHGVVARLVPPPQSAPKAGRAAAVAFLSREGRSALDLGAILAALYRLTPAEVALAKALSEGMTPEAFRASRGLSLATVKTQLQAVFGKTGTRRQSDLMRLVYSIAH